VKTKVAIVRTDAGVEKALKEAISLIGGVDDLNSKKKDVTIKIGFYSLHAWNHPTFEATKAVVDMFDDARHVYLAESDNRPRGAITESGPALERLQYLKELYDERVSPFNLSDDRDAREANILGEKVGLSHILYEPYVRVNFHAFRPLRGPGQTLFGTLTKNLLGIMPGENKVKYHHKDKLRIALLDMLCTIGGMDLAVIDGVYSYYGAIKRGAPNHGIKRVKTDLLIVGRDCVSVDAVGFGLTGIDPSDIDTMVEATERGLGQSDLKKIKVVGESIEDASIEHLLPKYKINLKF
jgi:uncharacterized protein (DUF362 family)